MRTLGFLCAFLASCSGGEATRGLGEPPAAAVGSAPLADIVAAHNAVRRQAYPTPVPALGELTETGELGRAAAAWATRCQFRHSDTASGENLYASSARPSGREVVTAWAAESAQYDYASNHCRGSCGHYTQMVWRSNLHVGCALERCTTGSPFGSGPWWLVVCRYEPGGNYVGERPY